MYYFSSNKFSQKRNILRRHKVMVESWLQSLSSKLKTTTHDPSLVSYCLKSKTRTIMSNVKGNNCVKRSMQFKPTCALFGVDLPEHFFFLGHISSNMLIRKTKSELKSCEQDITTLARDLRGRKLIWHRKKKKKERRKSKKKKKKAKTNHLQTDNGTICLDKLKMLCQQRETERRKEKEKKKKKEGGRKKEKNPEGRAWERKETRPGLFQITPNAPLTDRKEPEGSFNSFALVPRRALTLAEQHCQMKGTLPCWLCLGQQSARGHCAPQNPACWCSWCWGCHWTCWEGAAAPGGIPDHWTLAPETERQKWVVQPR